MYIYGADIPIVEILFILVITEIIMAIFILIELERKKKKLQRKSKIETT